MVDAGSSALVMVADDDRGFREAVRDVLVDEGFRVTEASNGTEAVAIAGQASPDVVLMDLRMPGVNGIEATRLIREAFSVVPVLIKKNYDEPAFRRGAEYAGAYGYLEKGCPPSMVLEMVRVAAAYKPGLEADAPNALPNRAGQKSG